MMDGVEASLLEFAVVLVGAGSQRDEALEQALGGGLAALFEQGAGVVVMLEVAVALEAAQVPGDEAVVVIDAQPLGVALQGQALGGVLRGPGIAIGVEGARCGEQRGFNHRCSRPLTWASGMAAREWRR